MVRGFVQMVLGVVVGVVLPAAQAMAQDSPTVYEVVADQNGNVVARQTLPDGTVVPVDLKQNGIVLDPGDVGREFTVGNPVPTVPKGSEARQTQLAELRRQEAARRANMLKEELGSTDEEWNILEPKIQAVRLLQSTLGERSPAAGDKGASVAMPRVMAVVTDLRARQRAFGQSIAENHAEPDIKSQMARFRESRLNARQELTRLQKELIDLLTTRQEAVLLQKRILE